MPFRRRPQVHDMALRACGHHAGNGMRYGAHLKTMRALQEKGLVEERTRPGQREPRWFLTQAGRDLLAEIGMGEPDEP